MDYDHNEEIVTDPIELRTIDEGTNHPVGPRSMATKRKLIEMTNDGSREVHVKLKKMGMDTYIRMRRDERAAKKEKKHAARQDAKDARQGQAKVLGFDASDTEELQKRRENLICKTGRKLRIKSCHKCLGCKARDCQTCIFCKDMKRHGGEGTKRQKCERRKCLNPRL